MRPAQNPKLKENLSKLKEAEQQIRENPSLQENLNKLREAEQKFRDNPSVKENLSKLREAEKKLREDAKDKQVGTHPMGKAWAEAFCLLRYLCCRKYMTVTSRFFLLT